MRQLPGPLRGKFTSFLVTKNYASPSRQRQSRWRHNGLVRKHQGVLSTSAYFLLVFTLIKRLFATRFMLCVLWKGNLLIRKKIYFYSLVSRFDKKKNFAFFQNIEFFYQSGRYSVACLSDGLRLSARQSPFFTHTPFHFGWSVKKNTRVMCQEWLCTDVWMPKRCLHRFSPFNTLLSFSLSLFLFLVCTLRC